VSDSVERFNMYTTKQAHKCRYVANIINYSFTIADPQILCGTL